MKTISFISNFLLIITLLSCSSVQTVNSYVAPDYNSAKSNQYLVITRADSDVRNAFESSISKELNADGYHATPSGEVFPNIDMKQKYNQAQIQAFAQEIETKGYNGVVLNVLKGVKNETSTVPVGGSGFYGAYPGYYYGFGGYYMNPWAYPDYWGPSSYDTETYQVYTLETTVYDLTRPQTKQLIGVVTTEITDPSSMIYEADEYAQKVVKELDKQANK